MAKQVQLRRGTTAEHAAFTGVEGELTVDTTKDTLVLHDAYQAGGYPLLREDVSNLSAGAIGIDKIANGAANQVLMTNGAGNAVTWSNNVVRSITFYQNNTQTTSPSAQNHVTLSGTYTKQYDDTDILVFFTGRGRGHSNGHSGIYFQLNGNRQYEWLDYSYNDWADTHLNVNGNGRFTQAQAGNAGSKAWSFGWDNANSDTGYPWEYWNANQGTRDGRARNTGTTIIFMEVTP